MQLKKQVNLPNEYPQPNHIILDCDAGGDDSQAVLVAFHLAKKYHKKIVAISCVEGNTTIENVIKNVLICKGLLIEADPNLSKQFPPILKGANHSLIGDRIYGETTDDYFHKDGICSNQSKYKQIVSKTIDFEAEEREIHSRSETFQEVYSRLIEQHSGDIGVLCIGPVTNLAMAYLYDPRIAERVSCVSIMGSQLDGVGMGSLFAADFNLYLDGHAAKICHEVFSNVTYVGIEYAFCYQTERTEEVFQNKSTQKAELVCDIYEPIRAFMLPILCDPLTCFPIMCAQKSEIKGVYQSGTIETRGKRTQGFFAANNPISENSKKAFFVTSMNKSFIEAQVIESYL